MLFHTNQPNAIYSWKMRNLEVERKKEHCSSCKSEPYSTGSGLMIFARLIDEPLHHSLMIIFALIFPENYIGKIFGASMAASNKSKSALNALMLSSLT